MTGEEPSWTVSGGRYTFKTDQAFVADLAAKASRDDHAVAALVAKGTPAIRLVYQDGGGHPSLKKLALAAAAASPELNEKARLSLGDVSRPDALAVEPNEVLVGETPVSPPISRAPARSAPRQTRNDIAGSDGTPAREPVGSVTPAGHAQQEGPSAISVERSSFSERFRSFFSN